MFMGLVLVGLEWILWHSANCGRGVGEKKGMSVIKIESNSSSTEPVGGGKEQGDEDEWAVQPSAQVSGATGSTHAALIQ